MFNLPFLPLPCLKFVREIPRFPLFCTLAGYVGTWTDILGQMHAPICAHGVHMPCNAFLATLLLKRTSELLCHIWGKLRKSCVKCSTMHSLADC